MKRQHPDNPDLFWCPKCKKYKDSNERMKKIMSGRYVPDDMDRAQREAEIMVKNCNIVMGFYQTAAKNARTMKK